MTSTDTLALVRTDFRRQPVNQYLASATVWFSADATAKVVLFQDGDAIGYRWGSDEFGLGWVRDDAVVPTPRPDYGQPLARQAHPVVESGVANRKEGAVPGQSGFDRWVGVARELIDIACSYAAGDPETNTEPDTEVFMQVVTVQGAIIDRSPIELEDGTRHLWGMLNAGGLDAEDLVELPA